MNISSALITGGTGFVGSAIVRALFDKHPECAVSVLDLRPPSETDASRDVQYYQADVTSLEEVSRVFNHVRPEVVIHAAGIVPCVDDRYSRKKQAFVFKVNVEGTRVVLQAARDAGVKAFVHTSSCTVVTDALDYELPNIDEKLPRMSHSLMYGESKAAAERIALDACDETMVTCAIRPTITFGPGDPLLIPTIHRCIAKGETPFILGTGEGLCDFTYVDNIADAHVLAAENLVSTKTAAGEAFFISNAEPISFRDFCVAIWAEFGHIPPFQIRLPESVAWCAGYAAEWVSWLTGSRMGLCRGSVYDYLRTRYTNISKARKVLGYTPRVGLVEGLHLSCLAYKDRLQEQGKVFN